MRTICLFIGANTESFTLYSLRYKRLGGLQMNECLNICEQGGRNTKEHDTRLSSPPVLRILTVREMKPR